MLTLVAFVLQIANKKKWVISTIYFLGVASLFICCFLAWRVEYRKTDHISHAQALHAINQIDHFIDFGKKLYKSDYGAIRSYGPYMTSGMVRLRGNTLTLMESLHLTNISLYQQTLGIPDVGPSVNVREDFSKKITFIENHIGKLKALKDYLVGIVQSYDEDAASRTGGNNEKRSLASLEKGSVRIRGRLP